ncbi:MAG TPA: hypothetical protein PLD09_09360 [Methanomassiliicoccaceae archaeon]|jgi:hypothetical protein|nr:hypothetical protein [Methanomassiliicoccaceae archaeon]HQA22055.1 hypothetical protein [Methanomassiliicoccaceae archaeon]
MRLITSVCHVTWCQCHQEGGCVKRFNGGRIPKGYGTPSCPGLVRAPLTTKQERTRPRHIVWKGIQTKLDHGGDME